MPRRSFASSLLFIDQSGVALQARRGFLCVRQGDGAESLIPPRMHALRAIVLAGHGVSITSEAIRWAGREGVALYLMERNGDAVAVLSAAAEVDGRRRALVLRQKQFAAFLDARKRLEIARKIVAAKLRTLGLHPVDARAFRAELAEARKIDNLLTVEARAGAAFFMRFRGVEMRFCDAVPDHWRAFAARAGTYLPGKRGTSKARHAATPFGAMLNYAYTVALAQCTRAVIGAGLDACHGFLHSPKPGRLSLSYDALELHRTDLTQAVFSFAGKRVFCHDDFEQDNRGVVRLSGPVAKEAVVLALRAAPMTECVKTVRQIAGWF